MLNRRQFAGGLAASWCGAMTQKTAFAISAPQPSAETQESMQRLQQNFVDLRFGMYIHLNMATYEEREWGDPKASPAIFNPRHLDTDQWARAALSAGMSYGCLTTKHHDGFCLWPTATSSPSVKQTAFREDIVRAYVDSFRRHGLKVCLYFSILDLRANIRPYVITPQKIAMIKDQLTELLTHYGEITALVIDGWNAAWSRISYEQLPFLDIYSHVKALQPNCLVSDYNEGRFPAPALYYSDIKQYEQHAGQTIPAHSIIPSQSANTLQSVWFWKESFPTEALRPAAQVVNQWLIPFNQRHCNLILNVAPNRDGRFDENAVDRLAEIGQLWKERQPAPHLEPAVAITTPNLAFAQPSYASSIADTSGPDLANDNDPGTYWLADAGQTSGWLELDLRGPIAFDTVTVIEPVYLDDYGTASRIVSHRVEVWSGGAWQTLFDKGEGGVNVYRIPKTTAERIRLTLTGRDQSPGIAEFGLYAEPAS
ncbi:MAG: alpha-L-fucosidase [Acidobacteriaceae bacterium]